MKNTIYYLLFITIIISFSACKNNKNNEVSDTAKDSTLVEIPLEIISLEGLPFSLVVTTQTAIIREEPSLGAAEITRKSKGDSLLFTNKISDYNTPIKIEGIDYNEPWLRVILEGNKMGWVYGGNINFKAINHKELKEKVLDQRAVALFGKSLAQQIAIYQKETQTTVTLPAFRTLYSRAQTLKDSLEHLMEIHLRSAEKTSLPDFFWLNELMTGLTVYYVESKNKYYLFKDLKFWKNLSLKTIYSDQDDTFIDLLLAVYPDSSEYYFYGWQLPVDDAITCSMLGSNIHQEVLNKIELTIDSNSYFKNEILEIKKAIIDDITIAKYYWLSLESINTELSSIIKKQYPFMVPSDWVELKTKRQLLDNYQQNGFVLNLFEGI